MEAATWTAIGVLAAFSFGSMFYLGAKIDALSTRLDARIDAMGARLDARIDGVGVRIDGLGSRLDELNGRFDSHLDRHARAR